MAAHPTAPYRIRSSVVRDGLAGQFGTENGPVAYARLILAPGPHAAVATSTGATESWATGGWWLLAAGQLAVAARPRGLGAAAGTGSSEG